MEVLKELDYKRPPVVLRLSYDEAKMCVDWSIDPTRVGPEAMHDFLVRMGAAILKYWYPEETVANSSASPQK